MKFTYKVYAINEKFEKTYLGVIVAGKNDDIVQLAMEKFHGYQRNDFHFIMTM